MTDPKYLRTRRERVPEAQEKRLVKYALVAGAGLLAAPAAQAGVIYTPADVTMTAGPYLLDIDNTGPAEFQFNITHGSSVSPTRFWGALRVSPLGPGGAVLGNSVLGGKAGALNQSAWIGPAPYSWQVGSLLMASQTALGWRYGYWNNVTDRYLGLRFQIGSDTHYGWARLDVSVDSQAYYTAHLTGYAYESLPDTAIHAGDTGAIPEPSTLGLLAGGILGLALWRRRKQKT